MAKSFSEARQEITGDSWLDDLARMSLTAAEAKSGHRNTPADDGFGWTWHEPSRAWVTPAVLVWLENGRPRPLCINGDAYHRKQQARRRRGR